MNHLYRSVWNDITRTFVAVAENVKQHGKSVKSDRSTGSLVIDAEGPGATHPPGTLRRLVTRAAKGVATTSQGDCRRGGCRAARR